MPATYDIFARKEHAEPLTFLGSVDVDNREDVVKVSLRKFGPESDWLEMMAVPHRAVTVVFSNTAGSDS